MKKQIIKDPTYNIYKKGGNVEKEMPGRGDGEAKKELMQLAKDQKDILFDVESEIIDILQENYNKEKKNILYSVGVRRVRGVLSNHSISRTPQYFDCWYEK